MRINNDDIQKQMDIAFFLKFIMRFHPEIIEEYVEWNGVE